MGRIDPGNAKLRELVGELIDEGLWRLLWMPPTLPYWPLEGPFEGKEHATKRLLFSAWNVVPDVVSAVLSYEAERLMMGGRLDSYDTPDAQQRPLLRLTQTAAGVRSRHRLLLLLLPCLPLADRAHPLAAPPGQDRRAWVRAQVDALLADPRLPNPRDGSIDDRWEWAAPLLLDPGLPAFLRAWRDGNLAGTWDNEPLPQPNPEVFGAYVDDLLAVDLQSLGRRPPDLAALLTDLALGSPAILAARSLRGGSGVGDDTRRWLAALIADAFWRLFNRPAVISLLRQLAAGTAAVRDESAYWRLVLHYCRQGNLQAVLDEQWHLLWDQESWSEDASADETAAKCARKLVQVVHPARPRPRRVLPGRARRIRRHRRTRRDPRPHRVRVALWPRPHGRRRVHQPGRRPGRVQQPVPALRAHEHVHRAGGARFPSLVPPPGPLETCRAIRWIWSSAKAGFTGTRDMPSAATSLLPTLTAPLRRGARVTTSGS